ncbi:unnamed protein product [Cuscuta campestris]|uniref:Uncharacterized protein n=1 Tax=Cuscuta campestris TaxID=132261 RepID=A0A484MY55_9ASTE|nr:unnamed protein product [Cuscuta campestris]VFQ92744.1 unnamed protein product [Cuscuta campestris]
MDNQILKGLQTWMDDGVLFWANCSKPNRVNRLRIGLTRPKIRLPCRIRGVTRRSISLSRTFSVLSLCRSFFASGRQAAAAAGERLAEKSPSATIPLSQPLSLPFLFRPPLHVDQRQRPRSQRRHPPSPGEPPSSSLSSPPISGSHAPFPAKSSGDLWFQPKVSISSIF